MTKIFISVVNMSIAASYLILMVFLVRFLFKKIPKWIRIILWGFVFLRLIFPFSIESVFSLIPSEQTIPINIEMDATPSIESGIDGLNQMINPIISNSFTPEPLSSANPLQIWLLGLSILWIIGIIILLVYTLWSTFHLFQKIKTSILLKENIYQSENIQTPFVFGILHPKIYIPFSFENEYVIAHEQTHIQRKDNILKPLGFLITILHWMNPFVWLAYHLFCKDIEYACDEKVISDLNSIQRAEYSQALVSCSIQQKTGVCPLAFNEGNVKGRVKSILYYEKPNILIFIISFLICAITSLCFLTNAKKESYELMIQNNKESYVYANEEIVPTRNQIEVSSNIYYGQTEICLKDVKLNAIIDSKILTPAQSVYFKVKKGNIYQIGAKVNADESQVTSIQVNHVNVQITESIPYIGDASAVNQIAHILPLSEGYTYAYMELQTDTEPYEWIVYVNGNGQKNFEKCSDLAFERIDNCGIFTIKDAQNNDILYTARKEETK
ncbi:M56 family metallopeptidase [Floccifex sp.]|uniref:M56 family metallopeptidase n=1 Tax=Floccifex sp. TaxID=2815810 RepID=UPI003F0E97E1